MSQSVVTKVRFSKMSGDGVRHIFIEPRDDDESNTGKISLREVEPYADHAESPEADDGGATATATATAAKGEGLLRISNTSAKHDDVELGDLKERDMQDIPKSFTHGWDPNRPWNRLRYYLRHPALRTFVSTFIILCNFLIYAEDPIAHSQAIAGIPVVGSAISLIITDYPDNHAGLWAFKFFYAILWILIGMYVGRQFIHHRILREWRGLEMFSKDKGTWFVMFFSVIIMAAIGASIFNGILAAWDPSFEVYKTSASLSMTNEDFMKVAASGTWMGDYLTAYMVIDMMLQDDHYPLWAQRLRRAYHGTIRVLLFWVLSLSLCTMVITFISIDTVNWDDLSGNLPFDPSTSELARAWLASTITMLDLAIVMQDWEFPAFHTNQEINLPGLFTYEIRFDFLKKWISFMEVHVTGKWFNYGIISIVMMLDMNMLKNQVVYSPEIYAQYVGPDDRIYSVQNATEISLWKQGDLKFTWESRGGCCGDIKTRSRFLNYSSFALASALIPAVCGFISFFILVRHENPDKDDLLRRDREEQERHEARKLREEELDEEDNND